MPKEPYLIQRILRQEYSPDSKGVDAYFSMDYMGSAEFEFGMLPKSLKAMRLLDLQGPTRLTIVCEEPHPHTLWYVGSEECFAVAEQFFSGQLEPRLSKRPRLKERSHLADFFGVDDPRWTPPGLIGWWDVENHWVLLSSKFHANNWLKGLGKVDL